MFDPDVKMGTARPIEKLVLYGLVSNLPTELTIIKPVDPMQGFSCGIWTFSRRPLFEEMYGKFT